MEKQMWGSFEVTVGCLISAALGVGMTVIFYDKPPANPSPPAEEKCAPVNASWSQSKRDLLYAMPDGKVIGIISFDRTDDSFVVYAPRLASILAHYTAEDLAKEAMEQFWRNNPCQVKEAR